MDDHQKTWDDYVPYAMAAYRNTVPKSTSHTPNMIVYGQEVSNPVDCVLGRFTSNQDVEDASASEFKQHQRVCFDSTEQAPIFL